MSKRWYILWFVCLTLIVVGYFSPPVVKHQYVSWAIRRQIAAPSHFNADRLARLLDAQWPDKVQGEKILRLLLTPKIITRSSYAYDQHVGFAVSYPYSVRTSNLVWKHMKSQWFEGITKIISSDGGSGGNGLEAHTFAQGIRSNAAGPETRILATREVWQLAPRQSPDHFIYEATIITKTDIHLVDPASAETVTTLSNPTLDANMHAAFTTIPDSHANASTGSITHWEMGSDYQVTRIPSNAAFTLHYQPNDQSEQPVLDSSHQTATFVFIAGESSQSLAVSCLRHLRPIRLGKNTGMLILRADPQAAMCDPRIKEIWGGEIRLPITFEVTGELPPDRP